MKQEDLELLKKIQTIDLDKLEEQGLFETEKPKPVQRALKRIRELEYITDVRIDEEFEACSKRFDYPNNRLTITIDYLDVELFKKLKEEAKLKFEYSEDH